MPIRILHAESPERLAIIRELFLEYAAWLGPEVRKRHIDAEIENLPGDYSPPRGCLLVAELGGRPAGCVALRPIEGDICEMKRFYVRPQFRGKSIGGALAQTVIAEGRRLGYRCMRPGHHRDAYARSRGPVPRSWFSRDPAVSSQPGAGFAVYGIGAVGSLAFHVTKNMESEPCRSFAALTMTPG